VPKQTAEQNKLLMGMLSKKTQNKVLDNTKVEKSTKTLPIRELYNKGR